ncbi:MAG: hypothetical protein K2J08_05405 [Ruminococcus sp.]|nr:hypothetical protein [Ruminococcus sp.]
MAICEELLKSENLTKILYAGLEILNRLIVGLCEVGGKLFGFAVIMFEEIFKAIGEIDWAEVGTAIVEGICSGLLDCDFVLDDYLEDFGENWLVGIQDIFDINSPSKLMRDEVGKYLALGVGEGFAENSDGIGNVISKAVSSWTSLLSQKSQESADKFSENTISVFGGLPSKIAEYLENTVDIAEKWSMEISAVGKNTAENFVDSINKNICKLPELSAKILNETSERFSAWGTNLINRGGQISAQLVSKIIDGVSGLPSEMQDIGRNLAQGLWDGFSGEEGWLKSRIYDFGNEIIAEFREVFGIHSPSAVMRDSVGKYLAQGIGVGFENEFPNIAKTALKAFESTEITAPAIEFSKIDTSKISRKIDKINLPEIEISVPEIENPKLLFNVPEIDFSETELPKIEISAPEIEVPELSLDVPEVEFSEIEIPDLTLEVEEIELPELEISVPEIEVPDLKIQSVMSEKLPENRDLPIIDESALRLLERQKLNSSFIQPSATSEITNNVYNYSSSTTNNSTKTSENPQNIVLNAQFVVGDEIVAEGVTNIVADRIDEHQGIKTQLRKRGLAR